MYKRQGILTIKIYVSFIQFVGAGAEMNEDNENNGEPKFTGVAIGNIAMENHCLLYTSSFSSARSMVKWVTLVYRSTIVFF